MKTACVWTALALLPVSATAQLASYAKGVVVDAITGQPLPSMPLELLDENFQHVASGRTALDGKFVFEGLSGKKYLLRAYIGNDPVFYSEFPELPEIWYVPSGPRPKFQEVVFRVARPPMIHGVVTDENGDPVLGADVRLYSPYWHAGRVEFIRYGNATTDDRGLYSVSTAANYYVVCVEDAPVAPPLEHVDFRLGNQRYHRRTCVPENPFEATALKPGGDLERNIQLRAGVSGAIDVHVTGSFASHVGQIRFRRDESFFRTVDRTSETVATGRREVGFEPGHYRVRVHVYEPHTFDEPNTAPPVMHVGSAELELREGQTASANIKIDLAGVVRTVVRNPEGADRDEGLNALALRRVSAFPEDTKWPTNIGNEPAIRELEPGNYWLITSGEGVCVESARLQPSGEQVLGRNITVTSGMNATLEVTVSRKCPVLRGRVMEGGKPVPFARVAALLSGTAQVPGNVIEASADESGEFELRNLSAGIFPVWAWQRDQPGFWGPIALNDVADQAQNVSIAAGMNTTDIEVPVIRMKAKP